MVLCDRFIFDQQRGAQGLALKLPGKLGARTVVVVVWCELRWCCVTDLDWINKGRAWALLRNLVEDGALGSGCCGGVLSCGGVV